MLSYSVDKQILIQYSKTINKKRFYRNSVGCKTYTPISISLSYSDDDSIFLDTGAGDDTFIGTSAKPKKTLLSALNACWSQKIQVIVLNNCVIEEDLSLLNNEYCIGVFAAAGVTALYVQWVQGFAASNSNSRFIAKTGNDSTGAGTDVAPYLTIDKADSMTDGSHQTIAIMDNGVYTVNSLAFASNFKNLIGLPGKAPTIKILEAESVCDYGSASVIKTKTQVATTTKLLKTVQLSNGNVAALRQVSIWDFAYLLFSDWTVSLIIDIYDKQGNIVKGNIIVSQELMWVFGAGIPVPADCVNNADLVAFNSGNVAVVWTSYNPVGNPNYLTASVLDDDGNVVIGPTGISDPMDWSHIHAVKCAGDTFTVYSINGYMGSWDKSLTAQYAVKTGLTVPATSVFAIVYLPTANQIGLVHYSSGGKLIYYNAADGTAVGGSLTWKAGTVPYFDATVLSGDRIAIVFDDSGDSDKGKLAIISNLTLNSTSTFETSAITKVSCATLLNGAVMIGFLMSGQFNYCAWSVDTPTQRIAPVVLDVVASDRLNICIMKNSNAFIAWSESAVAAYQETVFYSIIRPYLYEPFTVGTAAIIEGIIFDLEEKNIVKQLFTATQSLTLRHCEIKDLNPFYDEKTYLITSNAALDIEDCEIHNCAGEIYSQTNSAVIKNNLIHDILDNEDIFAVHIKGSGSGIDIEYNTIANTTSALYLESNNGSEIVKNNIIFGADNYVIKADTSLSVSYSIIGGTLLNVTLGASIVDANPQFLNEGELDPTMADYHLKNMTVGDPVTSSAFLLADGIPLERDAGCYDAVIIGPGDTFVSALMSKPIKLDVYLDPQGVTKNIMEDGSIKTSVKSWLEGVVINFDGLENDDRDKLIAILTCGAPEVLLSPDPITYPDQFNTYQVVYAQTPLSPVNYKLSGSGIGATQLTLERKY